MVHPGTRTPLRTATVLAGTHAFALHVTFGGTSAETKPLPYSVTGTTMLTIPLPAARARTS